MSDKWPLVGHALGSQILALTTLRRCSSSGGAVVVALKLSLKRMMSSISASAFSLHFFFSAFFPKLEIFQVFLPDL